MEAFYPDGSRYDGSMREGVREGRGTYYFPDGQHYAGRFTGDAIDAGAAGTLLMPKAVHVSDSSWMIPLHVQPGDAARIHYRAGFDKEGR